MNFEFVRLSRAHLVALYRMLGEYALEHSTRYKSHEQLKAIILSAIEDDFSTSRLRLSRTQINHLFRVLQARVVTLNTNTILFDTPGLSEEMEDILTSIESLDLKKAALIRLLIRQK